MSISLYRQISLIRELPVDVAKVSIKSGSSLARIQALIVPEIPYWFYKTFNVRQCENTYFSQRKRPCLQYQIKRCSAPCVGLVSPEDYKEDVNNSIRFLQGDTKELNQELIAKMEQAAADLEFEKAVFIEIVCLYFAKYKHSKLFSK